MRATLVGAVGILVLAANPGGAHANFVLQSSNPTSQGGPPPPPPGSGPVAPSTNAASQANPTDRPMPPAPVMSTPLAPPGEPIPLAPQAYRIPYAHGFGHQVPLSFAIRQIVPRYMRVRYANQVDSSALVDWKGGKPWNVVLVHAMKPLGYRVWVSARTVHIYE
jgi:hypothetical protein